MTTRADVSSAGIYEPGLKEVFDHVGRDHDAQYPKITNAGTSDRRYEEVSQLTYFGATPFKAEGTAPTLDNPIPNENRKRWTHDAYAMVIRWTHESIKDDTQYGMFTGAESTGGKIASALQRSNMQTMEVIGADFYNNGFTTETDINANAVFSATRPKLDGGTAWSNLGSDPLGFTSLQLASDYFGNQTDHRSLVITMAPGKLLIPWELRHIGKEILQTTNGRPFSQDNTINVMANEMEIEINHFLTSATAWFVLGNERESMYPVYYVREAPMFKAADDPMSFDLFNVTMFRVSVGIAEAMGLYGSPGT